MKSLIAAYAVLTLSIGVMPASELTERIKKDWQECATAMMAGDYERVLQYSHPRLTKIMGGKEKALEVLRNMMSKVNEKFEIVSYTAGEPEEPRRSGEWLIAIVPKTMVMKSPEFKMSKDSASLAISSDNGASWVFADLSMVTDEQFKQIFPELANEVKLPPKKQPVVERLAPGT